MGKKLNTPNFKEILPLAEHAGVIKYRGQEFKYAYCKKGANQTLFVFDPQTEGMTLTNACDFVLENIANNLIASSYVSEEQLKDLFSAGLVALRDSSGEWSTVKVTITSAANPLGIFLVTGVKVGGWKFLDLTPEYLALFKLLG